MTYQYITFSLDGVIECRPDDYMLRIMMALQEVGVYVGDAEIKYGDKTDKFPYEDQVEIEMEIVS